MKKHLAPTGNQHHTQTELIIVH